MTRCALAFSVFCYTLSFCFVGCLSSDGGPSISDQHSKFIIVLGVAQDAGYPQADCRKECCQIVYSGQQDPRLVSCLAVVDVDKEMFWMFDATPDFKQQLRLAQECIPGKQMKLGGVFLTHAHIGHYTGLVHLGREAMGAKEVQVYAMPKMKSFLESNGPWSQLVSLNNIRLMDLTADSAILLNGNIAVTPTIVPHRDEFSETVGFTISSGSKSALFIPDIDKWSLWTSDIIQEVAKVDYAFLDGSFYKDGEIPNRNMSEIPHPFVTETMSLFEGETEFERSKIHFIHHNHTNPILISDSPAQKEVYGQHFNLAIEGKKYGLD